MYLTHIMQHTTLWLNKLGKKLPIRVDTTIILTAVQYLDIALSAVQ